MTSFRNIPNRGIFKAQVIKFAIQRRLNRKRKLVQQLLQRSNRISGWRVGDVEMDAENVMVVPHYLG